MSVSFFKHKKALIDAYKDVLDESSGTDWALFTYEGKDNELKVAGTGEDGLEELEDEFNSSKIMYAFIRVKDPKTSLNKFIFLHWQGEGAPANRKGACANHVRDVERFFKGAHLTINARNEDDVTPEQIMEHVNRASASTYAFDKSRSGGSYDEPAEPVGSVYKRINPGAEISSTRNESYWEKQEREEEQRKNEEKRRIAEEKNRYAQEVKAREKESNLRRSQWEKEREQSISEKMRAAKLADDSSEIRKIEKEKWEAEQREFEAQSERGRKRSESIEKAAEAAHLVQKRDTNMKALWEQKIHEAAPSRPPTDRQSFKQKERAIESYQPADVEPDYETFEEETPVEPAPQSTYQPAEPEPQQYDSSYQNDQTWDDQQPVEAEDNVYDAVGDSQQPEENSGGGGASSYSARALYDYQAADETEITFDPDDLITNIEMIDEGWWRGMAPDGTYGLFPANYVELIE